MGRVRGAGIRIWVVGGRETTRSAIRANCRTQHDDGAILKTVTPAKAGVHPEVWRSRSEGFQRPAPSQAGPRVKPGVTIEWVATSGHNYKTYFDSTVVAEAVVADARNLPRKL
jgi:hypothetical protein